MSGKKVDIVRDLGVASRVSRGDDYQWL